MKYSLPGIRCWAASVYPALVGTTLPFWLKPPDFKFRVVPGILFVAMTLSGHLAFNFLHSYFIWDDNKQRTTKQFFTSGVTFLTLAIVIGICLNDSLQLRQGVPGYIFIVYCISVLFAGMLYIAPPFSFYRRAFGEVILGVGLGLLPLLGAYLVQAGDLTRTVYLASLPVVVSTGLWIWISELLHQSENKKKGYKTLAMHFPYFVSRKIITVALLFLIYLSLILAVLGRSSLSPFSLIAFFSWAYGWKIIQEVWKGEGYAGELHNSLKYSIYIHCIVCYSIMITSFI